MAPPRDHKFSLFRTYWLVWAVLFQAAVHVDCPRGFTARFMANMWAMFAVVFLAIYTANLAAFMITREEFHDFTGINDTRLQQPSTVSPAYKFGTVEETNSAMVLKRHHPLMYHYMVRHNYNRPSVQDGVKSIKKNELDAFIYDATVLDYLVGQDDDCQILTVGSWYSMSGYGLAFPRGSKYLSLFNNKLMSYKDNVMTSHPPHERAAKPVPNVLPTPSRFVAGDIERLQRFWMTGTCKPKKQQRRASEPLAIEQFLSAYLLLGIGMVLAIVLLALEHVYFKYVRKHLAKKDSGGCCALVSLWWVGGASGWSGWRGVGRVGGVAKTGFFLHFPGRGRNMCSFSPKFRWTNPPASNFFFLSPSSLPPSTDTLPPPPTGTFSSSSFLPPFHSLSASPNRALFLFLFLPSLLPPFHSLSASPTEHFSSSSLLPLLPLPPSVPLTSPPSPNRAIFFFLFLPLPPSVPLTLRLPQQSTFPLPSSSSLFLPPFHSLSASPNRAIFFFLFLPLPPSVPLTLRLPQQSTFPLPLPSSFPLPPSVPLTLRLPQQSMGKSLTFRGAVYEATDKLRRHRCRDPLCDTHIWKVKHELDMARMRIKQLEKELEANGVKPVVKKQMGQPAG
ncbi:hypothetical protein C7M84_023509 [Penaeus vannamei]|uniref:Ionotropic glutamate receptor C-terminal domain-containing protein n=1 Tax=Penaeus vannamei TaxID=6689 RepID=A0A3R7Q169_PENVA|nr:hypothetical protein C7M84_023509 [Penaeus vannamei]